ncbi:MAG TPA: hypothetical protein PKA64_12835, partial [Myxococcota bacterium]|nr:hypothetical protein [Myxococcota bacterium]
VIVGDASFASNELVAYGSNRDLFLGAVTWLLGEDDLLAAGPEPSGAALDRTDVERAWMMLMCLAIGPLVPAVFGVQRWWTRRRG